jgi:hypothetical protein
MFKIPPQVSTTTLDNFQPALTLLGLSWPKEETGLLKTEDENPVKLSLSMIYATLISQMVCRLMFQYQALFSCIHVN